MGGTLRRDLSVFGSVRCLILRSSVPVTERVPATTIEAVMAKDLVNAKVMDPDLPLQSMTPRRALSLLKELRLEFVSAGDHNIELVSQEASSRPRC